MDPAKVTQMVEVLNRLAARDALCLLVGCALTVLDEAPSAMDAPLRKSVRSMWGAVPGSGKGGLADCNWTAFHLYTSACAA